MSEHLPVKPTSGNGWASWFCIYCQQLCASDNPCDCCDYDMMDDDE